MLNKLHKKLSKKLPVCFPERQNSRHHHKQRLRSDLLPALHYAWCCQVFFNWAKLFHCGFHLHFPDGLWYRAFFHVLIGHLHIYFLWSICLNLSNILKIWFLIVKLQLEFFTYSRFKSSGSWIFSSSLWLAFSFS